jgi:hypothetical protein
VIGGDGGGLSPAPDAAPSTREANGGRPPGRLSVVSRKKAFDSVKMTREIRDRISRDIQGMTLEEEKEYLARLIAGRK